MERSWTKGGDGMKRGIRKQRRGRTKERECEKRIREQMGRGTKVDIEGTMQGDKGR